jgi:hypothetical protein
MDEKVKTIVLAVPLDASKIKEKEVTGAVKVAARDTKGRIVSQTVKISASRKAVAKLNIEQDSGSLDVVVGPADATDDELMGLETLRVKVSARQLVGKTSLELAPVIIPTYYWHWWLLWCRKFTVRGVVRCPDGNPVPGAKVCVYDTDWLWWWSSRQLIGCAVTDGSGAFEITFRWCCGWLPWWWWRRRFWRLEPDLMDRIVRIAQLDPDLPALCDATPYPTPAIFNRILAAKNDFFQGIRDALEPAVLPGLRQRLLKHLPRVAELEKLKIWPWWPWYPWRDCSPDIIFKVTQDCEGAERVIVEETIFDTRWDIPTSLNVTLTANENACCVGQPDTPEGNCLLLVSACDDLVAYIGGNPPGPAGVFAPTDGFRNPGGGGTWSDRPYAGIVNIHGEFGDGAEAAYYEFQWSADDGVSWNDMPPDAAGNFARTYHGPQVGAPLTDPPGWHSVNFVFDMIEDTLGVDHYVVSSRQHFEITHDPGTWGLGNSRQWAWTTVSRLMRWKTQGNFADGRYRLRVKSWTLAGNKLDTWAILPLCNTSDPHAMTIYLDNRVETSGPVNANGQPCGEDKVHLCTVEPDTDIVSIAIIHNDGTRTDVDPCGNVPITDTDMLQIDFVAYDPDGHLADYLLELHWGEDEKRNLLLLATPGVPLNLVTLTPVSPVAWAPPAAQVGPTYAAAQADGATPPVWHGGALRLTLNATDAFKETCCYVLRLIARKRTINSCDDDNWTHVNRSERSFMIQT